MALITPTSLYYIISVSIASRLLIFTIQLITNVAINDHYADAYRNRYYKALVNDSNHFDIPQVYLNIYQSIEGLTKWDSQYFLEISMDGYVSEEHLAFLPIFPAIISIVRQLLFEHQRVDMSNILPTRNYRTDKDLSTISIENYIRSALIGFALNNFLFFPLAAISLFILTKLVKKMDDKYAKNVVWWFCFNPASVFFSACYSESLFATLSFIGMFLIEYKAHNYFAMKYDDNNIPSDDNEFKPLTHLNRLLHIYLPSLSFFALSSATRSNGLTNIGFLGYQFLLKYSPLTKQNFECWSIIMYISVILEFLQDILVLFMSAVLAASGYITFQIYSYMKFCNQEKSTIFREKGALYITPDWCQDTFPHPYRQAQQKYWLLGAFEYYKFKQLPNFLIALPVTYIVFKGSLKKSEDIIKRRDLDKRQLVYYIQAIVLTILCAIFAHVQITTRLLAASCPVLYWIMADNAQSSRRWNKFFTLYYMLYIFVGTSLHSNYYPWT